MGDAVEIRQVDVGRGKAGKIGRCCGRDLRHLSILEPNPNDVLNAVDRSRRRLRLNLVGNLARLSVHRPRREKNKCTQDQG